MLERLQKIIAASGLMSRRAAEDCLREGRVKVNGVIAHLGDKADPECDRIDLDGALLPAPEKKVYLLLYKPRGYVTTLHDEKERRNVIQLLPDIGVRVYPVGRLDLDSEGLLLLTNDGELADRLMHPSHEVVKCYHTWVRGENVDAAVQRLRQPMEIDGYTVRGAEVQLLHPTQDGALLSISIHEGRNRQVRKMCSQAGLEVTRLCRVSEGPLTLSGLKSGQWRYLTEEEVAALGGKTI